MTTERNSPPEMRTAWLETAHLGLGPPVDIVPPLSLRISGPYEDNFYVVACPDLLLAVQGTSVAHALGQIEGMIAFVSRYGADGLSAEGQRLAHALAARRPKDGA